MQKTLHSLLLGIICLQVASLYSMENTNKKYKIDRDQPPMADYYPFDVFNDREQDVIEYAKRGAYTQDRDSRGRTPLHYAAHVGRAELITALLAGGMDVYCWDRCYNTPLHYAADSKDNLEAIKVLLNAHADVNAPNSVGATPLHLATDPLVVRTLIEAGANCHAQCFPARIQPHTPFQAALRQGNMPAVEAMILTVSPKEVISIIPKIIEAEYIFKGDFTSLQKCIDTLDPDFIVQIVLPRLAAADKYLTSGPSRIYRGIRIRQSILKAVQSYPEIQDILKSERVIKSLESVTID